MENTGTPISEHREPAPSQPKRKRHSCFWSLFIFFVLMFVLCVGIVLVIGIYQITQQKGGIVFPGDKVAVVDVEGIIAESDDVVEQIHTYRDNKNIKAMVLKINSPGGGVAPTQEIYNAVLDFKKTGKPVVAVCTHVAASGGYYTACAANHILVQPGTLTGSIGVYIPLFNWEDLMKKVGVKFYNVKKGRMKDFGSPDRPLTEEESKMLEGVVTDIYNQFVEAVIRGRYEPIRDILLKEKGLPAISEMIESATETVSATAEGELIHSATEIKAIVENLTQEEDLPLPEMEEEEKKEFWQGLDLHTLVDEKVRELAQGQIFTGRQAIDLGLTDRYGDLEEGIQFAGKLAGLEEKPGVVHKKKKIPGFWGSLQKKVEETELKFDMPVLYLMPY